MLNIIKSILSVYLIHSTFPRNARKSHGQKIATKLGKPWTWKECCDKRAHILIYEKNQCVQDAEFWALWASLESLFNLICGSEYGKAFRKIGQLIGYDIESFRGLVRPDHDAKRCNLQPEKINILHFILHRWKISCSLNEDEYGLPLLQLMAEVSLWNRFWPVYVRHGV